MKDLRIARIYGEDTTTGGGGATTIDSTLLSKYFRDDFHPNSVSGVQNFRFPFKQMIRVGVNHGKLLDGVRVDEVIQVLLKT